MAQETVHCYAIKANTSLLLLPETTLVEVYKLSHSLAKNILLLKRQFPTFYENLASREASYTFKEVTIKQA